MPKMAYKHRSIEEILSFSCLVGSRFLINKAKQNFFFSYFNCNALCIKIVVLHTALGYMPIN